MNPYHSGNGKKTYSEVLSLFKEKQSWLSKEFETARKKGRFPMISSDMVQVSKIMKKFQYLLNDNIIRIWKDEILLYWK